jgi:hypothetical protein
VIPGMIELTGDVAHLDGVRDLLTTAAERLGDEVVCGHPAALTSTCVRCADGLRCLLCATDHYEAHGPTWRLTCDVCGQVDAELVSIISTATATVAGRLTIVLLDGLGLCTGCCHIASHGRGGVG